MAPTDAAWPIAADDRMTPPTRRALQARADGPSRAAPRLLSPAAFATLTATLDRLIPVGARETRVADVLDAAWATGVGDGWRLDAMPADAVAMSRGLEQLNDAARAAHATAFVELDRASQDALLARVADGSVAWPDLDAATWFVELLTAATEAYVAHPATLDAMGVSAPRFLPRWDDVGLNATQPWEPATP